MACPRTIFVISDLHIGGDLATLDRPRGFRMCTRVPELIAFIRSLDQLAAPQTELELVINGDFVDFLAEHDSSWGFVPFLPTETEALGRFNVILERDRELFSELNHFASRHLLTILLGNHDIELAYPAVTAALESVLGGPSERLTLRFDGQPYVVGDASIEHGNARDVFNHISSSSIEALRQNRPGDFEVPPGSRLVADIMNPLKRSFPFLDLLKPERESAIPMLLALDPSARGKIAEVLKLVWQAERRRSGINHDEAPLGQDERCSGGIEERTTKADALVDPDLALAEPWLDEEWEDGPVDEGEKRLAESLVRVLGSAKAATEFNELVLSDLSEIEIEEGLERAPKDWGALVELALRPRHLRALWRALQVLHTDLSFVRECETDSSILDIVMERAIEKCSWVVMGHTHLAKDHRNIIPGCTYLNSGTWADLIPFPESLLSAGEVEGVQQLKLFLEDLRAQRLDTWIDFRPTYVRLDFDGQRITRAELRSAAEVLAPEASGRANPVQR